MDFKIITSADKEAVKQYIDKLADTKQYKVSVNLLKSKRSISQNKLYHLWLNYISKETGNDTDNLHRFFAGKFIGFKNESVFGREVHNPISTTTLSKEAFTDFLDKIQAFMTEQGYPLPTPEDLYFETFLTQHDKNYD